MHFAQSSSRALTLLASLLLGVEAGAAPPATPPPSPGGAASDAALLALAKGQVRGNVLATARAQLPSGPALLAAVEARPKAPVSFVLLVFTREETGSYAVAGHDVVATKELFGAPVVALTLDAPAAVSGALTAVVGWKAADGSAETQAVVYRHAGDRLARLLAASTDRAPATASGRPSIRHELTALPTSTGGFKDLRVRTLECAPQGECGDPIEVVSYAFDGVRYAPRPFAIPYVERIEASSELESSGALENHAAGAAIDNRADTAWCEGAKGAGWFQKLELTFAPAQRVKAISILPGGPKGTPFEDWTRPKRVRLLFPDDRKVEADLADEQRLQRIALPGEERIFSLTLILVDVYKGKREDACIAELDLEVEP